MDPVEQRRLKVRLGIMVAMAVLFFVLSQRNKPSVEDIRKKKYGNVEVETLKEPDSNEVRSVKIHLFKPEQEQDHLQQYLWRAPPPLKQQHPPNTSP